MWLTACRPFSSQPDCEFDVKHPMIAQAQSHVASFVAGQERVIMVFWHERALAMPELWPRCFPLYGLQSTHAYCQMMALVIGCFGL